MGPLCVVRGRWAPWLWARVILALLLLWAVGSADVSGAGPAALALQLPRDADVWISGPTLSRQAAGFPWQSWVDRVGDVNGDGTPDLAVRNQQGHGGDETQTFVLFGGRLPGRLDLPTSSSRGFSVRDASVKPAGDVNGDGRADLVRCSASYAVRRGASAEATVLMGRPGRQAAVDQGFHVFGADCGQGAGDMNGDGLSDVLFLINVSGQVTSAAVVYGNRKPVPVLLDRLGRQGFRITGFRSPVASAKPAGDLNGDGRADLLLLPSHGYSSSPRLQVVFGRRHSRTLNLNTASARNLPVIACRGNPIADFGAAGDVNGDGIDDVVASSNSPSSVFIVFGRRGTWPHVTSCGGRRGFEATATTKPNPLYLVGSAGDIDGDGLGDLLISAPGEQGTRGEFQTGAVYVVFGRQGTTKVDLRQDVRVIRIAMQPEGTVKGFYSEEIGWSAAAPGDVNHDGRPDIVAGGQSIGSSWLISGAFP